MKNVLNRSRLMLATLALTIAIPFTNMAQETPLETNLQLIDHDVVKPDNTGKIDPPPPPTFSADETTITRISFYPNPCKDKLKIEFGDNAKFQKVQVYNLIGNLMYEATLPADNAVINTSGLKAGIYILRTEDAAYRFTKV